VVEWSGIFGTAGGGRRRRGASRGGRGMDGETRPSDHIDSFNEADLLG